jgi:hypothetical protein
MGFILKILKAHGLQPYRMEYKAMTPKKNWLYGSAKQKLLATNRTAEYDDAILEDMSQMNDLAKSGKKTLIFKCHLSAFKNPLNFEQV